MVEREKPWLPENYARFQEIDARYQWLHLPPKIIGFANILAFIPAVFNPVYGQHFFQLPTFVAEVALFLLTIPRSNFPSLNILGRRAHRELYSVASQIGTAEGWNREISTNDVITRIRDTFNYASNFALVRGNFNLNMPARERIQYLPTETQMANFNQSERSSLRKALYIVSSISLLGWKIRN